MKLERHSNGVIVVVEVIGLVIVFVLVEDLNGKVAEVLFVFQVFELNLVKSNGQILGKSAK
ncbi:MAG: hypothetical protein IJG33_08605 [Selenomonadaceae bacterium]|nr:hypothetical protein [Selenomonadaceae bacterium]